MSNAGEDRRMGSEETTTGTLGEDNSTPTPVNQPAAANGVAPDNSLAQQAQQVQQVQNQNQFSNQNINHHQTYGYNMGQYPQNFQPSQQQPLGYPQYGQCYPNQQQQYPNQQPQFQPFYYPPVPNMHQPWNYQQQYHPPQPPQPPANQQPAGTGNNTRDMDVASAFDGDQSDGGTEQENVPERRYSGPLADQLHKWAAERKQGPNEGPEIYETLAEFMSHHLKRAFITQELDQSVKDYPTMKNVPLAVTPELEEEIAEYTRSHRDTSLKGTEAALKSIQKGILSALNALGPLAEVIMKQGAANEELGAVSTPVLDIIKLLANASAGISKKRRDLLIPHIDAKYKKLSKHDEGFDQTCLFGGNLSERARKLKAQTSLMKEVMKSDTKSQGGQGKTNPTGNRAGNYNNGGYRAPARTTPYPPRQQGRSSNNNSGQSNQTSSSGFRKGGSSNSQNNNNNNKSRRP